MRVNSIILKNFRIYDNCDLDFSDVNIVVGKNAQGKTSLLEALYFLGVTKSHKTNVDSELIKFGSEYTKISSIIDLNEKSVSLQINVSKMGKKAIYNGIEQKKLSEYIGRLNVVMFAPEDLNIIKSNPQYRRRFIDVELGQTSRKYLSSLSEYKKMLKQRNELLKTMNNSGKKDIVLLDTITEMLLSKMKIVYSYRNYFVDQLQSIASKIHSKITNSKEELTISYKPSLNFEKQDVEHEMKRKYEYDIITGTTHLGIHRDDLIFEVNGLDVNKYCSQGQQRTVVLSLKLAMIDFIFQETERFPILLLDDVFSELDMSRKNELIKYVKNKVQTFITAVSMEKIDSELIKGAKIIKIENGAVKECLMHG